MQKLIIIFCLLQFCINTHAANVHLYSQKSYLEKTKENPVAQKYKEIFKIIEEKLKALNATITQEEAASARKIIDKGKELPENSVLFLYSSGRLDNHITIEDQKKYFSSPNRLLIVLAEQPPTISPEVNSVSIGLSQEIPRSKLQEKIQAFTKAPSKPIKQPAAAKKKKEL